MDKDNAQQVASGLERHKQAVYKGECLGIVSLMLRSDGGIDVVRHLPNGPAAMGRRLQHLLHAGELRRLHEQRNHPV